jgi:hypothetical protein
MTRIGNSQLIYDIQMTHIACAARCISVFSILFQCELRIISLNATIRKVPTSPAAPAVWVTSLGMILIWIRFRKGRAYIEEASREVLVVLLLITIRIRIWVYLLDRRIACNRMGLLIGCRMGRIRI